MECKEVLNKVDKYFEDRLSDIEKHNIKKHLEKCNKCKQEYEDMSFAFSILDSHFISAPDDLADKIMMKISSFENSKKKSTKVLKNLGASFVAAGIMISLLNFSDYNHKILARGIFRSAFEINQVVTSPITKISEGLKYITSFHNNNSNK
ncbi:zf-HC2 domain-containing protein [Proteiniborus sp. MB09-C3]|uniref:zf-HC2 domain-containing protein n=1 Tax=Proteiniborus sp. MB09-C3 TaxID=3050072 RepID=UPI0025556CE6|nr:zf-HC2 domain-containing protein [Proteiniborus sp. MB09-C3]WIV11392.1 zf-HC2 domain-containing protein [Proteiniborus sp. MB09-C3]